MIKYQACSWYLQLVLDRFQVHRDEHRTILFIFREREIFPKSDKPYLIQLALV
jgi:hypothetical protein